MLQALLNSESYFVRVKTRGSIWNAESSRLPNDIDGINTSTNPVKNQKNPPGESCSIFQDKPSQFFWYQETEDLP